MTNDKGSPSQRNDLFRYSSVQRISKIPVVESGYNYMTSVYTRVKNSNRLVHWSLANVEGGIQLAVDKTLPTVFLLDLPLTVVDSIICKGLDTVSVAIPAINYPPDQLVIMSKDYVNSNLITPVLSRADSVKQLGLSEASRVGDMAASRLDNALNIADLYVDKYLPDSADTTDGKKEEDIDSSESKTTQAIHHMNRLGKKLQRRLTKRTLMEAEALKKGSQDIAQALIYLADLLLRDPKGFADKMNEVWNKLSEDEPENQVPPANLEQLVALLTRETARKVVHVTNFVVSTLPAQTAHAFRISLHHAQNYTNYFLKVVHLEGAKGIAFATSSERLSQLRSFILHFLEILGSRIKEAKGVKNKLTKPIAGSEPTKNDSPIKEQETPKQDSNAPTPTESQIDDQNKHTNPEIKEKSPSPLNNRESSPSENPSSSNDSSQGSTSTISPATSNTESFASVTSNSAPIS